MSMIVAHNVSALNAQKNLYTASRGLNSSISKLSSGFRINTGQDGPADLVISEQLRAQINGVERAVRNTSEANNVLSIAEGALNEMNSILKKMKALAIHAANNGVTSPDQVASDQAEMDSGIQTLERIANSTKFSDQFLLNGAKDITYSVSTEVKGTQNNKLINAGMTNFNQIFKRDGYQVSVSFNGATNVDSDTNIGNATMAKQASKAYLEVDVFDESKSQVDENGNLTQGQSFILTGSLGSKQFRFSESAHLSEVVNAIHNVAGSTGVDAALIFNRSQQINNSHEGSNAVSVGVVKNGNLTTSVMYDNYYYDTASGTQKVIANNVSSVSGVSYGMNTDGNGNVYVKLIGCGAGAAYEIYKDASLSKESLIGTGMSGNISTAVNNSDFTMCIAIAGGNYGDTIRISLGNIGLDSKNACISGSGSEAFAFACSTASGVQLGVNTSSNGKIYLKTVYDATGCKAMVYAYNNELMREQDMVAKTVGLVDLSNTSTAIILDSIWNDEKTANTGLGLALRLTANSANANLASKSRTTTISFENLAMRVFSTEYGSGSFIKVQQFDGALFVDYEQADNYDSARLIEKDTTFQKNGQDATINVNGQQMKTNGLELNLATADIMASVTFNEGKSGSTTMAQVGYGDGTIFTKATSLTLGYSNDYTDGGSNKASNAGFTGLLNNSGHNTKETVGNFQGGMQLQLGEGSGDQERTVIGLRSMSTANLGRIELTDRWDRSSAVMSKKTLSIQDVMGGQVADLKSRPEVAMKIIEQAITDVSEMRAQIGAVQANMLQTNENNLRVSIENLTKTESAIRDTDMATEMTEFTKQQILSNAGVSMVGQSNSQAQSVLALLG